MNSPMIRLVELLMANACDYFPTDFSWLVDELNALIYASGEGLRCHSLWLKRMCWKWNCSSWRARVRLCGELGMGRGRLEGRQLRGWSPAGLLNQPGNSAGDHQDQRKRTSFFRLTFNRPTYFLQTVAALKTGTLCHVQSKGCAAPYGWLWFGCSTTQPWCRGGLILKMLTKIWEQVLLLPAVQFCRWQNPFGRNQSISSCFVIVAGAEGNGRRQKKWSDSRATSFSLSYKDAMWFWWQVIWTAASHHLYKHYQPET